MHYASVIYILNLESAKY